MSNFLFRWLHHFIKPPKETKINLDRRTVVAAGAAGLFGALFVKVLPEAGGRNFHPVLVRPPGSLPESEFLSRCIRCGECMKVCPTNAIQPAVLQAGLEGNWTPVLNYNIGYCSYECTLCTQVCPTGAIQPITIEQKRKIKIGTAFFDRNRCLPYASQRSCIVCEEHCPIPKKAIWVELVEVTRRNGEKVTLKQPRVDLELCTGCGICQHSCPIADQKGIYVTSVGETRHEKNGMLLPGSNLGGSDSSLPAGGNSSGNPYGSGTIQSATDTKASSNNPYGG